MYEAIPSSPAVTSAIFLPFSSKKMTTLPASAEVVTVGVLSFVRESDAPSLTVGFEGFTGGSASTMMSRGALTSLMFWAASMARAVMVWVPSVRKDVCMVAIPLLLTTPSPIIFPLLLYSFMVFPTSLLTRKVGLFSFVMEVSPSLKTRLTGLLGAMVSMVNSR